MKIHGKGTVVNNGRRGIWKRSLKIDKEPPKGCLIVFVLAFTIAVACLI